MTNKKAQVTVIIIIAILFVGILVALFAFRGQILPGPEDKISEVSQINIILEDCLKQRSIDAVLLVGLQGGYTTTPKNNVHLGEFNVGFGLFKGRNILPSREKIENEISDYVRSTITSCIEDEEFPNLLIIRNTPEVKAEILKDRVEITPRLPLTITKQDKTVELNDKHNFLLEINLIEIHETANQIIQKHLEDPEFIDLTYLSSLEFDATYTHYTDTTLVYKITDTNSKVNDVPYSFMFAIE